MRRSVCRGVVTPGRGGWSSFIGGAGGQFVTTPGTAGPHPSSAGCWDMNLRKFLFPEF